MKRRYRTSAENTRLVLFVARWTGVSACIYLAVRAIQREHLDLAFMSLTGLVALGTLVVWIMNETTSSLRGTEFTLGSFCSSIAGEILVSFGWPILAFLGLVAGIHWLFTRHRAPTATAREDERLTSAGGIRKWFRPTIARPSTKSKGRGPTARKQQAQ